MKERYVGWVFCVVGLIMLLSTPPVFAAGSSKIGVVDGMKVLELSQWGRQASEEFRREAEKVKADLEPKEKALLTARDEFDKKKDVLDQKAKTKKEQELRDLYQDFQKQTVQGNAKFEELQAGMFGKAREAVRKIVEKIAKDEKFDLVFDKSAVVFVASDKDEITQRVVTELDKMPPFKY